MITRSNPAAVQRWGGLALWLAISFSATVGGQFFPPGPWYQTLHKPVWTPPSWLFGPVWTVLYSMMGVAAWFVWRQGGFTQQRKALALFLAQLILNAAWTPLFFGLQRPDWALVDICLLWVGIVATMVAFRRASRVAAFLLSPYLAWVSFAAVLNLFIWKLNR